LNQVEIHTIEVDLADTPDTKAVAEVEVHGDELMAGSHNLVMVSLALTEPMDQDLLEVDETSPIGEESAGLSQIKLIKKPA